MGNVTNYINCAQMRRVPEESGFREESSLQEGRKEGTRASPAEGEETGRGAVGTLLGHREGAGRAGGSLQALAHRGPCLLCQCTAPAPAGPPCHRDLVLTVGCKHPQCTRHRAGVGRGRGDRVAGL